MLEDRVKELRRPEGHGQLFGGEDGSEILGVDTSVAATSLFKIDVPLSSQGVRFRSETARAEVDDHVEGGEIFGPTRLAPGEELRSREIFKIFVVRYYVYRKRSPFEVMSPGPEGFEDS